MLKKRPFRALPVLLAAYCSLLLGCSSGDSPSPGGTGYQNITGYVQTAKSDENDYPIEVYLFDGKQEFQIHKDKFHSELLELIDRKITAHGVVSVNWDKKKVIDIQKYEVID